MRISPQEINQRSRMFAELAKAERPIPPDIIQALRAVRPGGGSAEVTIEWGTVIEAPQYGDPENFLLPNGRSYYTMRLVTSAYSVYAAGTSYANDSHVVYPDAAGRLYKSKGGTGTPPVQSGHQPDTSPTYWDVQEEIKIEYALGAEATGQDLRRFVPWYAVGQVVPLIKRTVTGIGERYYIWAAQTYGGEDDASSLRWNSEDGRAMACYS